MPAFLINKYRVLYELSHKWLRYSLAQKIRERELNGVLIGEFDPDKLQFTWRLTDAGFLRLETLWEGDRELGPIVKEELDALNPVLLAKLQTRLTDIAKPWAAYREKA